MDIPENTFWLITKIYSIFSQIKIHYCFDSQKLKISLCCSTFSSWLFFVFLSKKLLNREDSSNCIGFQQYSMMITENIGANEHYLIWLSTQVNKFFTTCKQHFSYKSYHWHESSTKQAIWLQNFNLKSNMSSICPTSDWSVIKVFQSILSESDNVFLFLKQLMIVELNYLC